MDWYWPTGEDPRSPRYVQEQGVHLLAPFDPVVWDRNRFERFWGWPYRFEAYVPQPKRERGYYAMPLLWRGRVIGWGNLSVRANGQWLPSLQGSFGYVDARAACGGEFRQALDEEMHRIQAFLGLGGK